jgi:hypothetical protein
MHITRRPSAGWGSMDIRGLADSLRSRSGWAVGEVEGPLEALQEGGLDPLDPPAVVAGKQVGPVVRAEPAQHGADAGEHLPCVMGRAPSDRRVWISIHRQQPIAECSGAGADIGSAVRRSPSSWGLRLPGPSTANISVRRFRFGVGMAVKGKEAHMAGYNFIAIRGSRLRFHHSRGRGAGERSICSYQCGAPRTSSSPAGSMSMSRAFIRCPIVR